MGKIEQTAELEVMLSTSRRRVEIGQEARTHAHTDTDTDTLTIALHDLELGQHGAEGRPVLGHREARAHERRVCRRCARRDGQAQAAL